MTKKSKVIKSKHTEVFKASEIKLDQVMETHAKYVQTYYKNQDMMNGVQIRDTIYDGEIGGELDKHEATEVPKVGSGTLSKTLGRNKSGCNWKKGDGQKSNNKFKSQIRKTWDKKVEER